jgi:hypothetical protein
MNPWGLAFIAAGLFTVVAGALNWEWFMNHPKARFVCSICGHGGARIFYIVVGSAFIIFGALLNSLP